MEESRSFWLVCRQTIRYRIVTIQALSIRSRMEIVGMTMKTGKVPKLSRQEWIEAALDALAEGGIEAIRVEALAKRLKVTKGGFYWHFRDRSDLFSAVLEHWRVGRMAVIERQTRKEAGSDPRIVLKGLLSLYAGARNEKGRGIELAIRDWARRDTQAAAVVAQVDEYRLDRVGGLFRALGCGTDESLARAYLFYAYVFGESLLVPSWVRRVTPRCAATVRGL